MSKFIPSEQLKTVVEYAPLISIDLVTMNHGKVLLGRRVNKPAKDFYFTTAKYLFNIFAIVDPDIILLGGGISAQPAFVEGVKRYVEKLKSISMITNFIKVDVCKFGNDSNLLGALYSFRQMYLEN